MKLQGKIALVTGASRGIGRAVATGFAKEGAKVFLVGNVDETALNDTIKEIRDQDGEAVGDLFDVSDPASVTAMADAVEKAYGHLDILVNNAGIIKPTPLLDITPEQWMTTVATHLHGTFFCTREVVKRFMQSQKSGKIINLTAPAAIRGNFAVADYASAKGGIIAFTLNAAKEFSGLNIQVNAVLPVAESRMTDALYDFFSQVAGEAAVASLKQIPKPDILLPTFLYLASSDSDYVTGQVIAADGGLTL